MTNTDVKTNGKELQMKGPPGSLAEVPISIDELEKDVALGGKVGMQDIAIPYLYLLQTNSPQVNPDHEKHIEGAVASMFYLTVIEKIFEGRKDGLILVPCYYERLITEWIPREQGGGLIRSYPAFDPIMDKAKPDDKGRMYLDNGHLLVDTAYHYDLVLDPVAKIWHQCIMPLKSTFLKRSRKLNSDIQTTMIPGTDKRAPRFLYKYVVKTMKEQKDDNVWNVPVFSQSEMVDTELYQNARTYAKIAASNSAMLRRPAEESASASPTVSKNGDDEIPF